MQLLDLLIPVAQAQSTGVPGRPGVLETMWPLILMIPLFYFMLIRPQMRRSKETREMMGKLAKGDEIVVTGGLAGRIAGIGEVYLTVELAPGVEVKVQKTAVTTVLPKGTLKSL